MYGNCGCAGDAFRVFKNTQRNDVELWNVLIAAYARAGHSKDVFKIFKQMLMLQVVPDVGTINNLLSACSSVSDLKYGMVIHNYIFFSDLYSSISIVNALITMYGRCGSLCAACKVFSATQQKDVVTWTAIMSACSKQGKAREALGFFKEMLTKGILPDRVTFISVLDVCTELEVVIIARIVHALIIEIGIHVDIAVGTAILNIYGKCGYFHCARYLFLALEGRSVAAWNALITAYAQLKLNEEALVLFCKLQNTSLEANKVTFISTLNACTKPEHLSEGMLLHCFMVENGIWQCSDVVVGTSLLSMYSECGSLCDAHKMFHSLSRKNVISWTSLLSAYVKHGKFTDALALFCEMNEIYNDSNLITFSTILDASANLKSYASGDLVYSMIIENELQLDVLLKTSFISMYGKCGRLEDANHIFASVRQKNLVLFTAMIGAYGQFNLSKEALSIFMQMCQEGVCPDKYAFSSILDAAKYLSFTDGRLLHSLVVEDCIDSDPCLGITLLNMYHHCGTLDDVISIFHGFPTHNIVSFNAMLAIYSEHEQGNAAFELFQRIQYEGFSADYVTFISILDACAGFIDLVQARSLHVNLIESKINSDVKQKTALLNMYSKCGDFEGAKDIFESLPAKDLAAWNAMITAFSDHGRGKEALELFKRMQTEDVNPNEITFAAVLAACSRAGLTKVAREYFDNMPKLYGIKATVEHYACMVDAYGRAGLLSEAESLLRRMPNHPNPVAWLALLSACKAHCDVKMAKLAAERIFELDPRHMGARLMLSNIYAIAGMWDDAADVISEIS
ncbi:hypothetical protein KP509_13G049100 [Ceratopteris richardii]|nr:hypothetical protein KP509_13G049100 [Ceratopteris richardii]